jgi:glycosyltransferase involved in cell wall biosynthesis
MHRIGAALGEAPSEEAAEPRIAVVIPCFNEAPHVQTVVADFARELPRAQIYVFDNASSDGTAELARAAGAAVIHSPLRGKGNVIRHMANVVDADVFVLVDGDDTYSAAAAPRMIERLARDRLDMLVGARLEHYEEGSFRTFHRLGNRIISGLISALFRTRLTDVLSGYRILSRGFVNVLWLRGGGFEVETELTLQALHKRLPVGELPVEYGRRVGSRSKLNTWTDGFLILRCIFLLFKDYKPLVFFAALAAALAVASLISGSAPVGDFLATGYVTHVPRAILAAGLGVLAAICLTAGLILDTIAKLHEETIEIWKRQFSDRR